MPQLPVIDITPLRSDDAEARQRVAALLGTACRETGFFSIVGHGVAPEAFASVFAQARSFFALPIERKLEYSMQRSPNNRGYAAMRSERLNAAMQADMKEAFNIGLELPPGDPQLTDGTPFRGVNFWPDLPGWRETMLEYYDTCCSLGRLLHRGFALDLGIEEDFFEDKLDAPIASLRMLHYPGLPDVPADQPGAGEHTDFGNLTLLVTDGVAGLELQRLDGTWLPVADSKGGMLCNIGDCLMRWTGDAYRSTAHRVKVPRVDRYSLAFFLDPNPDAEVSPIRTGRAGPARYEPTTGAAYLRSRLDASKPAKAHTGTALAS